MKNINVDPYAVTTQMVGVLPECLITHYSIPCNSREVYMPPGVLKHLKKRNHWNEFLAFHRSIPGTIANPDYAGQNPKEPDSVELYKFLGDHILIAVKLNPSRGLFLGSFYKLDNGENKIQGRLRTGRIHPFSFFDNSANL